MESAAPLITRLMESDETLKSRRGSLVTDDKTIYDELIAPLEATMMRSIWQVVRNADLAEDCLQDALAVVWKKRFQIRLHPNPRALILKICLNAACDSLRRLERMRRQTDLSRLDNAPAPTGHNADRDLEEREIEESAIGNKRRAKRNANINRAPGLEVWDCAWICSFPICAGFDDPQAQSVGDLAGL